DADRLELPAVLASLARPLLVASLAPLLPAAFARTLAVTLARTLARAVCSLDIARLDIGGNAELAAHAALALLDVLLGVLVVVERARDLLRSPRRRLPLSSCGPTETVTHFGFSAGRLRPFRRSEEVEDAFFGVAIAERRLVEVGVLHFAVLPD